ncbi:hypothetical protein JCM5353_003532 [Sporobolomyces roseus]
MQMHSSGLPTQDSDFIRFLHNQLENPQYPFALRWRADGSFIFQTQSTLESIALEQLGFKDRVSFFSKLHDWGFEQLTIQIVGTTRGQDEPIFRHPSGAFTRGDPSRLQYIRPHPRTSASHSPSLPSQHIPSQPLRPIAIIPSLPRPSSPRGSVPSQPQQSRRIYSTSEPYRETRGDPSSEAVSSPMVRSGGSSTFSSSTRSWSPVTPTTQFPSPIIDGYFQFSPTFPSVDTVPPSSVEEPDFAIWNRDSQAQTGSSNLDSSLHHFDLHKSTIGGLAGLSFDDTRPSLSPTRTPLFVLPSHNQHATGVNDNVHSPRPPSFSSLAPTYLPPARSFGLQQPPAKSYYPSVLQPPTISVSETSPAIPFNTPVVQRKERRSAANPSRTPSSIGSSQPSDRSFEARSSSSCLSLLASAAAHNFHLSASTSSRSNEKGRSRAKSSRSPNAYNPYRFQAEANKLHKDSTPAQHLVVPQTGSAGLSRSKSAGSTPRTSLTLPSVRGLVGPASSFSRTAYGSITESRTSYWSLGDHYLTNPILSTTQRPTSSVRNSPRPVPSSRSTQSGIDVEMST